MASTFLTRIYEDKVASGAFNWLTASIKMMLVGASNNAGTTHAYISTVPVLNELSGTGYTRKALTGMTYVFYEAENATYLDADDPTWTTLTAGTVDAILFFVDTGNDATSWIIGKLGTVTNLPANTAGGNFTLQWATKGIIRLLGLTSAI